MKISDYIRPNPDYFIEKANELLATIKNLMEAIAIETNDKRRKELSKEIRTELDFAKALTIRQEEKTGSEMIDIFMEIIITQTPSSQKTQKIALYNAQKILNQLLSDYLQDVECRKKLIVDLKEELETASLQEEFIIEIMNEVHEKSRYLSQIVEETIVKHNSIDFFRTEIALGYLALIPETTEEEIGILGNKLLKVSKHYLKLVRKYEAMIRGSIFPIKKGDMIFGTYKEDVFIAKVTKLDNDIITCKTSFAEEASLELRFDLITGISSDKEGILLGNTSDIKLFDQDTKPEKGKLAEYSKYVFVKWEENNKEKIGIGSYYFKNNKWFISVRDSLKVINISDSLIISWFYIPEDIKEYISGYSI